MDIKWEMKINFFCVISKNESVLSICRLAYRCYNSTANGVTCELSVLRDDDDPNATDKCNNPDIKRQSVEFLFAAANQKIISLPQASLDKFINVVTLNLISVNLNSISYRHFKNLIQLKYLDLSCNKLRKLPRKLFKENENLCDVTFTNNQVWVIYVHEENNSFCVSCRFISKKGGVTLGEFY
jgi:hypothetical protein